MQPINIRRSVLTRNLSLEADLIYPTGSLSNAAEELEQLTDSSPSNVALARKRNNETSSYLSPYTNLLVDGRRSSMGSCNSTSKTKQFPPNLLVIVQSLPGNAYCMDCGHIKDLDWASVSFGVLMCDRCAYEHLEQGFDSKTKVRSLKNHDWTLPDTICLLEGGNEAFSKFLDENNKKQKPTRRKRHTIALSGSVTSAAQKARSSATRRSSIQHFLSSVTSINVNSSQIEGDVESIDHTQQYDGDGNEEFNFIPPSQTNDIPERRSSTQKRSSIFGIVGVGGQLSSGDNSSSQKLAKYEGKLAESYQKKLSERVNSVKQAYGESEKLRGNRNIHESASESADSDEPPIHSILIKNDVFSTLGDNDHHEQQEKKNERGRNDLGFMESAARHMDSALKRTQMLRDGILKKTDGAGKDQVVQPDIAKELRQDTKYLSVEDEERKMKQISKQILSTLDLSDQNQKLIPLRTPIDAIRKRMQGKKEFL